MLHALKVQFTHRKYLWHENSRWMPFPLRDRLNRKRALAIQSFEEVLFIYSSSGDYWRRCWVERCDSFSLNSRNDKMTADGDTKLRARFSPHWTRVRVDQTSSLRDWILDIATWAVSNSHYCRAGKWRDAWKPDLWSKQKEQESSCVKAATCRITKLYQRLSSPLIGLLSTTSGL